MKMIDLRKQKIAALVAAMAFGMLSGCSTTGESGGGESGGGESFNECTAKCESSDLDCREDCT
jgi:hypothetical protein